MAFPKPVISKLLESADGTKVFAEATGDPSKPSIVFVHGLALSGAVFDGLFQNEKLLEKLYMVRYDVRGHARSGQPEGEDAYESIRYAQDFEAVVKAFNLNKPIFAGWSVGCVISTDIIAHLGADTLSAVVFIAGPPTGGAVSEPCRTAVLNQVIMGMLSPEAAVKQASIIGFIDACFKDPVALPFVLRTSFIGTALLQTPTSLLRLLMRTQDSTKLFEAGKKGLPVLLVCAAEDACINNEAVVEASKREFTNLTVKHVEGAGHAVFVEAQDLFCAALLEFLEKLWT